MNTILIVDDNSQNLYFLEVLLTGNGYTVVSATNGEQALAKARENQPILAISDILMPVMDGWTLCREWKLDPVLKNVPFVYYTATYTEQQDEDFALKLGADRFITKPQAPEQLMDMINEVLAQAKDQKSKTPTTTGELRTEYSEALFRKLQKKVHDLEAANHDLAETIRKLENAEDSLSLLSAAVCAAPTSVVITNSLGDIEWVNPAFAQQTGYVPREAVGRNLRFLDSELQQIEERNSLWRALALGKSWRGELINKRKNGEIYTEDTVIAPVRDHAGEIKHFVSISVDVTEKKRMEEQILRTQRLESIGMLAAGIAHDLNNVLTPVIMATPVLRDNATDPHDVRLLNSISASAARGAALIRQILSFAKGVTGKPQLVQVSHLLSDLHNIIAQTFPKSITLAHDEDHDLWPIRAIPTQIHQVLLNLCVNARDAMPQGGTLTLRAENCTIERLTEETPKDARPGNWLRISVEDTGTGIPPELLERIFEPFFTTKPSDKGTGLGLSTVKGIVNAHRGFLSTRSELGKGTLIQVYFPAVETDVSTSPSESGPSVRKGKGELILLVDDEQSILEAAGSMLRLKGYQVLSAASGVEAIKLFASHSNDIDLTITDLDMPGIGGNAFIKAVFDRAPKAKVIVMSGSEHNSQPPFSLPEQQLIILNKPCTADELNEAIERLLEDAKQD